MLLARDSREELLIVHHGAQARRRGEAVSVLESPIVETPSLPKASTAEAYRQRRHHNNCSGYLLQFEGSSRRLGDSPRARAHVVLGAFHPHEVLILGAANLVRADRREGLNPRQNDPMPRGHQYIWQVLATRFAGQWTKCDDRGAAGTENFLKMCLDSGVATSAFGGRNTATMIAKSAPKRCLGFHRWGHGTSP